MNASQIKPRWLTGLLVLSSTVLSLQSASALDLLPKRFQVTGDSSIEEMHLGAMAPRGGSGRKHVGVGATMLEGGNELGVLVTRKYNPKKEISIYKIKSRKGVPQKLKAKISISDSGEVLEARLIFKRSDGRRVKLIGPDVLRLIPFEIPSENPAPNDPPAGDPVPPPTDPVDPPTEPTPPPVEPPPAPPEPVPPPTEPPPPPPVEPPPTHEPPPTEPPVEPPPPTEPPPTEPPPTEPPPSEPPPTEPPPVEPPPTEPPPTEPPPTEPPPPDPDPNPLPPPSEPPPPTEPPEEIDYEPLTTNVIAELSDTAHWHYTATGFVEIDFQPVGTVLGFMDVARDGLAPVSPVNDIEGEALRVTQELRLAGERILQTYYEYGYTDDEGRTWSLGGQDTNGFDWWWLSDLDYSATGIGVGLVRGQLLQSLATMSIGDHTAYAVTNMTAVSANGTPIFRHTIRREIVGIEVVTTPLGKFEAYRIEQTLDEVNLLTGERAAATTFTWERPDMGAILMQSVAAVEDTDGVIIVLDIEYKLDRFDP